MRLPSLKDKILEKEAMALKPKKEKKTAGREPKRSKETKKSKKK